MKRNWWLILAISIALALTFPYVFKDKKATVIINNQIINVELAKTDLERATGLSGRPSLAKDQGMLFIFEKPGIYPFWMKDTLIPLDIIWIEKFSANQGKIVEKATLNPMSGSNIDSYTPKEKANYVLELNANSDVKIGDEVKIEL